MEKVTLAQLGAKILGQSAADSQEDLGLLDQELGVTLPDSYRAFLREYGAAVVFDKGARFRPDQPSPVDARDGFQDLEVLYGLGPDKNGLRYRRRHTQYDLPSSHLAIGEAPGGNQICLVLSGSHQGAIYFWNHEAEESQSLSLIASSFEDFLGRLVPDADSSVDVTGIIESESWLDI